MRSLLSRVAGKYRRTLANRLYRRRIAIKTSVPIISFTFDDAPTTAFTTGGEILTSFGAKATFYVSLGLLGSQIDVGTIASPDHLLQAVEEGNEIGCHTFDHLDTWQTTTEEFIGSVVKNRQALGRVLPGTEFKTFAYPINEPRPAVKSRLEKYFMCCRGGGQVPNIGIADLNLLRGYFLDRRKGIDINDVRMVIDYNASCKGWLIFATHDVTNNPSPYGCTIKLLRDVVEYSARSGALLLPVREACEKLQTSNSGRAFALPF
jgi:peptidoglycan/xylan/chitin deacetylase (PgdA/CDA1 family)